MGAKEHDFVFDRERPACFQPVCTAERQGARGLDRAHQKPQIQPGERVELPLPDGEKRAPPERRQPAGGFGQIRDLDPAIVGLAPPGRPEQTQARHAGRRTGGRGMGPDLDRERMSRIDQAVDAAFGKEPGQALGTAETTASYLAGRQARRPGASRERADHLDAGPRGARLGKRHRLPCAPQNQNPDLRHRVLQRLAVDQGELSSTQLR
jgi:hypothetical protein